jgi:hypothetical protein
VPPLAVSGLDSSIELSFAVMSWSRGVGRGCNLGAESKSSFESRVAVEGQEADEYRTDTGLNIGKVQEHAEPSMLTQTYNLIPSSQHGSAMSMEDPAPPGAWE